VAFATTSGSLVTPATSGVLQNVFVKDTQTGNVILASVSSSGAQGNGNSPIGQGERPSLSGDGSWVVFSSSSTNISPRGSNIVAHNNVTGQTIDFAPPASHGVGAQTVISGDSMGRYVVFFSSDSLDTRFGKSGVVVHDRITHCLLNFAEGYLPDMFPPGVALTQILAPYTFRAYSNFYLGISTSDEHVYVLPVGASTPLDEGVLTTYLGPSGCR
jgi:hypothetical protein